MCFIAVTGRSVAEPSDRNVERIVKDGCRIVGEGGLHCHLERPIWNQC